MARLEILCILSSSMVLILGSCVAPKAIVVEPAPVVAEKTKKASVPEPSFPEPSLKDAPVAHLPEDPIRMPNYLELPDDGNFRRGSPRPGTNSGGTGAITSRPPTEPPSRVKPQPKEE